MKQFIAVIATLGVLGLSIFLIWTFFKDYQVIYLISGILIPIIMALFSSQYCAGNLFAALLIVGGIIGYIYLEEPYNLVAVSVSIYMVLFKVIRYGNEMTGTYIDRHEVMNHDLHFLNKLLNSDWYLKYKDIDPKNISANSLIDQEFYQKHIGQIVQILIRNNFREYSKSKYNKGNLLKIHSIGIIYTLPRPISKNSDGIVSTGTQMLINVFSFLKEINIRPVLDVESESEIILGAKELVDRTAIEFGGVTDEEFNRIKNSLNQ